MHPLDPRTKRIAIIGAGPAGLILARILLRHRFSPIVFEREQHSAVRSQGGSLDMHVESGQFAIECAGLTGEFKKIARYNDQETRLYDMFGELKYEDASSTGDRPEVDRAQLRQMLLDSLPAGTVRWDHELQSIEQRENSTSIVTFRNGSTQQFDLVVGADGAWSKVRALVSDVRPVYSGVTFASIEYSDVDKRHPDLAQIVGHGLMFALGESKAIIGHRNADAHLGFYVGLRVPEDWAETGFDQSTPEASRISLAAHFHGWSPKLLASINRSTEPITLRRISALPIGHTWANRPGITLVGDSAHLMSPFAGEGANLAMQDAADLALELASSLDMNAAIARFESKMFARAEVAAHWSAEGIDGTFSPDGLAHTLEQFNQHQLQ